MIPCFSDPVELTNWLASDFVLASHRSKESYRAMAENYFHKIDGHARDRLWHAITSHQAVMQIGSSEYLS